jgi:hypothetical protein
VSVIAWHEIKYNIYLVKERGRVTDMKDEKDFGNSSDDHLAERTQDGEEINDIDVGAIKEEIIEKEYLEKENIDKENIDKEIMNEELSNEKAERINPWHMPIYCITWGFFLTSFTLNFLLLQYILPTLGIVLMYLGFRSIRKGNRWFFAAWIIAAIKLIWQAVQLMLYATPAFLFLQNNSFIKVMLLIFQIALFIALRNALQTVFTQADIKPTRDPALLAIIWTCLIALFAAFHYVNGWIIVIPLFIFFFYILRSLSVVREELGGAADLYVEASEKWNNGVVTAVYLVCCILLVFAGCTYANHIRLNASEQTAATDSETRSKLIELGFPKNIIKDISDKDISTLSKTIHVQTDSETLSFHHVEVTTRTGTNSYSTRTEPRGCNLQATIVYMEFPDHLLYVIEYFNWIDSKAYWQDGFMIWNQAGIELLNGALLYQKNGVNYTARIPRLKCETVKKNSFFGLNDSRQISGAVSYPFQSEHQRGYIFYRIQFPKDQLISGNCLNYLHQDHPIQFPYVETEQRIGNNIFSRNMQQHYTTYEFPIN